MLRPATSDDLPFLWAMLGAASAPDGPPLAREEVEGNEVLRRYLDGWGRPGDVGVVAEADPGVDAEGEPTAGGELLGAAWYRSFTAAEPGYGFVDEATPEIAIACTPEARGKGLGRQLVAALLGQARSDGVAQLCLSVVATNVAALRVYEHQGFVTVAAEPDGMHLTMVAPTTPREAAE
ncbi:GNAT family N-acetyltransferase [Aquihabitans sp. G128]|uniref:GNAT family N-acetyltransferase n=1 Tax=Aquihabitans sp. G128 TaxID=2849779 RepID=UPI001C2159C1|nr:GNAT family N-acetyltransferase [Aquihabitans sp. G128]QXC60028.1 GNAT family N-acetyltransferase [Aquihabitans sp. G128]